MATANASAAHVIAGFRYQILHSVAALMNLQRSEELLLEVSEDFTIVAADATTDVQVKNSQAARGPRPFSLQSPEVASVLDRFWIASDQGALDRRVIFLARGGAASERDFSFPNGLPGLAYWRSAALDSDTQPLRAALSDLLEETSLGDWIASNPTDIELRDRLLRRVQWQLESSSSGELTTQLRDLAVGYFHSRNLPISAAAQAVRSLTDLAFETAAKPRPQDRRLTKFDLDRTLEEVAGTLLVGQQMAAAPRSAADESQPLLVTELGGTPSTTVPRTATVTEMLGQIVGQPLVWIHGANGVGKSTLARLVGQRLGGHWLDLDLRPVKDAAGSLAAWRELIRAIALASPLDGVIIDDFDGDAAIALRARLAALAQMLGSRGTRIIVTSHRAPSPAYLLECGSAADASVHAPYFSGDDITELVRATPAPVEEMIAGWSIFIRVATGGGHPLLTAAKVSSLRARGWPDAALTEDLAGEPSRAIQLTRDEARRTLLNDLSELDLARSLDAGKLLRRIGSVFDRVDEGLVRQLYLDPPALPNGGDALAVLRGTWLEALPDGDLRISPLLSDIVTDVPIEDVRQLRRLAAEYWLTKRVLDERTLPLCFWNAFLGEHSGVLMMLFELLHDMPKDRLRGAATLLSPITGLTINRPLLTAAPAVAANLRLLQFDVADALEQAELAGSIARRLIEEIDAVGHKDIRNLLMYIASSKILMAESADITPAERISYALAHRQAELQVVKQSGDHIPNPATLLPPQFGPGLDGADFRFAGIVQHIKSSSDALDAFTALDGIAADDRNRFIDAMSAIYDGHSVFVHSGWAGDQIDGRDMSTALGVYERIEAVAAAWNRPDVSIQIACARSVILDEGLGLFDKSIALIDRAVAVYGDALPLWRQKSKVLGHAGRDLEAIEILLKIEDEVGNDSALDRSLALRDGALSAARSAQFEDALRLLNKALLLLEGASDRRPWAAGLMVEKALILWRAGNRADAIRVAGDSLEAVEDFPPDKSRQAERSHQYARAIVGLFFSELDTETPDIKPPFTFGQASCLESEATKLLGCDLKPLGDNWRILAVVEAGIGAGADLGIFTRSIKKQSGTLVASIELILSQKLYEKALKSAKSVDAFRAGIGIIGAGNIIRETERGDDGLVRAPASDFVFSTNLQDLLSKSGSQEMIQSVALDIITYRTVVAGESMSAVLIDELRTASEIVLGGDTGVESVLSAASGDIRIGPTDPASMIYASALAISHEAVENDLGVRFYRDMMLVGRIATSFARGVLVGAIAARMAEGWLHVVEDQSFMLQSPVIHVPEIEMVLKQMTAHSLENAATLLLAAAPAVGHRFGPGWEESLRRLAFR